MTREFLTGLDRLLDGPCFADELGMPNPLDEELRQILGIKEFRIVPAKSAMEGVYGIFFLPKHHKKALARYADRYRWIFEILLMGEEWGWYKLSKQGVSEEGMDFLVDVFPWDEYDFDHNPIVYSFVWRSKTFEQYLHIAHELQDKDEFIPSELLSGSDKVGQGHISYFSKFIRHHLIESADAASANDHDLSGEGRSDISIHPNNRYYVTTQGKTVIPQIVNEYERIFIKENFEPLRISNGFAFENYEPSNEFTKIQVGTSDKDDVLAVDGEYKTQDADEGA